MLSLNDLPTYLQDWFLPSSTLRVWLWARYFAVSPLEAEPKEMPSLPKSLPLPLLQEEQSKCPQEILEIFLQRAARLLLVGSFCS